ncbi:MAG: dolichyl-phosphate beta-glucosyltransferase [bacterium]
MDYSLIIPAYNEETRLKGTLETAIKYLNSNYSNFEILVVDDGSTDKTCEVVRAFDNVKLIELGTNQGKGAAVRKGILSAVGKIRIFTDADLSTPITEIPKAIECINKGYDIFIGSRALDHTLIKKHQPIYREFMGKTFNKFVQVLVLWGIKDTQCGFKAFTDSAAEAVFSKAVIDRFSFDVEALFIARKLKLRIAEVPIVWYNDERTKVSAVRDSYRMFLDILKIRALHKNLR